MFRSWQWSAAALFLAVIVYAETRGPSEPVSVDLSPDAGSLLDLLKKEVGRAKGKGLTPVVQMTATWCVPCRQLEGSMGDAAMQDAFAGTYVIRLDLDAWKSQLADAGFTTGGVPAFFRLGDDGRPVAMINGGAWAENIPKNMAPPLKWLFRGWDSPASGR